MGRGHSRGECKLQIVLIHFVNKSLLKVLYWTSLEIERCHQRFFSFIQKSPLPIFKIRCILFQMAVIFEVKLKRQVPLKQIWTHFTEWEECVMAAGKAAPQLVHCTMFQLDYASFFLRVVIWESLGSFIMSIWMFQHGILANQSVPSMRLVDLAVVAEMTVFNLDITVCFSKEVTAVAGSGFSQV